MIYLQWNIYTKIIQHKTNYYGNDTEAFKNKIPLTKYNDKHLGKVKKQDKKNMYLGQPMSTNNL